MEPSGCNRSQPVADAQARLLTMEVRTSRTMRRAEKRTKMGRSRRPAEREDVAEAVGEFADGATESA
jgi:hypothetical protein